MLDQDSNKSQIAHPDLMLSYQSKKRRDHTDAVWSTFKYHDRDDTEAFQDWRFIVVKLVIENTSTPA